MKKPSRAQRVRDYLSAHDSPRPASEIVQALQTQDVRAGRKPESTYLVLYTLNGMFREGQLSRIGDPRAYAYGFFTGEPAPEQLDARAKKTTYERERRRRLPGCRDMATYRADVAARKAARIAKEQAAREARAATRAQRKAEAHVRKLEADAKREVARLQREALDRARAIVRRMKAEQKAKAKPKRAARAPRVVAVADTPTVANAASRVETVAEWMARTGRTPEVLPPGAWSTPLRSTGHRAINDYTWRQREAALA